MKKKLLAWCMIVFSISIVLYNSVFAQEYGNTSSQQEPSSTVSRLDQVPKLNLLPGQSISYEVVDCLGKDQACIVTASAQVRRSPVTMRGIIPFSSSATLVYRWQITNVFGLVLAAVENQQPTTFFNQHGKSPFAWNSFPTAIYQGSPAYTWTNKSSSISPPANQQAIGGQSIVQGQLNILGVSQGNRTAMVYFLAPSGSSWQCLAG